MSGARFRRSNEGITTIATLGVASVLGATLATAMVAGLLFCFAHSVMPGLGTLDDHGSLLAFQRIDAAISNPWMMLTFRPARRSRWWRWSCTFRCCRRLRT